MTCKSLMLLSLFAAAPLALAADGPQKYTETIPGTATSSFEMLPIPGGTLKGFKLNKEAEPKDVEIKPFLMSKTEARWDEYSIYCYARDVANPAEGLKLIETRVRPSKPYETPTFNFGDSGYPCLASTRAAAVKYCEWLSEKTGRHYRLPTSAEWEWAARGGGNGQFTADEVKGMAWYQDNSKTDDMPDGQSHPVGKLRDNGYGLYDMLGNVAEWVLEPGQDPLDRPTAAGGSWKSKLADLSPSYRQEQQKSWTTRDPQDPKSRWWLSDGKFVGFRVVTEPK